MDEFGGVEIAQAVTDRRGDGVPIGHRQRTHDSLVGSLRQFERFGIHAFQWVSGRGTVLRDYYDRLPYLGAAMGGLPGAVLGLLAIFLPGALTLLAALPFWGELRSRPAAQAAMRGVNAAVMGILAAAFYSSVWTSAVLGPADFAAAVAGFVLLVAFRSPPLAIVLLGAGFGIVEALVG